jgi:hypothetical protein
MGELAQRLDLPTALFFFRSAARRGAGLVSQEELLEQPQHREEPRPLPPDDGAPARRGELLRRRPRRPRVGQRARRRRRAGELLVEVLPQQVHLVLRHGAPPSPSRGGAGIRLLRPLPPLQAPAACGSPAERLLRWWSRPCTAVSTTLPATCRGGGEARVSLLLSCSGTRGDVNSSIAGSTEAPSRGRCI